MIETVDVKNKKWSATHSAASKLLQDKSKKFWKSNQQVPSAQMYNLTICDDPKFIWFRNAKVGTRSVFSALRTAEIDLAAESTYSCYYFPQEYKNYFKFAFVRSPWDRFVSGWLNKVVRKNALGLDDHIYSQVKTFSNFVSFCADQNLESWNSHFRLQSKLLDTNELNYVGRHETFGDDLKEIFGTLNLPLHHTPTVNKTKTREHYSTYYSDQTRDMIGSMYRKDIQLFGYTFEDRRA